MNNSNQSIRERWALGDYRSIGKVISPVSAMLVRLVNVKPIDSVLDVACGFGNTAITARRAGAKVTGIDITPELLTQAKEEESIAKVSGIDWREGNAESLPFEDESFDIVLSTFGHMFALNQKATAYEMQRVLKKGGRMGFATWSPETCMGKNVCNDLKVCAHCSKQPITNTSSVPYAVGNPKQNSRTIIRH